MDDKKFDELYCYSCSAPQTHVILEAYSRCVICQNERDHLCPTCAGGGTIDIGDCEDGVWDECPECGGAGRIE